MLVCLCSVLALSSYWRWRLQRLGRCQISMSAVWGGLARGLAPRLAQQLEARVGRRRYLQHWVSGAIARQHGRRKSHAINELQRDDRRAGRSWKCGCREGIVCRLRRWRSCPQVGSRKQEACFAKLSHNEQGRGAHLILAAGLSAVKGPVMAHVATGAPFRSARLLSFFECKHEA